MCFLSDSVCVYIFCEKSLLVLLVLISEAHWTSAQDWKCFLFLQVSVCVCLSLWERRLCPTAVVTQLCLVYISSDNSGSKHHSLCVDMPLMAFEHVCGWACLCVKMNWCTCMKLCVCSFFPTHIRNVSLNIHSSSLIFSMVFVNTMHNVKVPKCFCWNGVHFHIGCHYLKAIAVCLFVCMLSQISQVFGLL